MKTFPKCQYLQRRACGVLCNMANCSIGEAKAIESGGIEVLLAAINNHLKSADVCDNACSALWNIARCRKENTELLINLGVGAAVAKVRTKWPDNNDIQAHVRDLADMIVEEMRAWGR
jgi:hypothetical protein